jgi:hypothetical protein
MAVRGGRALCELGPVDAVHELAWTVARQSENKLTWMMNSVIGLEALYCTGFAPSRIPAWGGGPAMVRDASPSGDVV